MKASMIQIYILQFVLQPSVAALLCLTASTSRDGDVVLLHLLAGSGDDRRAGRAAARRV